MNPFKHPPDSGGNLMFIPIKGQTPSSFLSMVNITLQNYKYAIVGSSNGFSNPKNQPIGHEDLNESHCVEQTPLFLLGAEPGTFLLCNGFIPEYSQPLGLPTGKYIEIENLHTSAKKYQ
eukprot:m.267930 g.267930  ORF g.267930 m.267930 type:complete len:119 (-) comp16253_c0_seq2:8-364(-)